MENRRNKNKEQTNWRFSLSQHWLNRFVLAPIFLNFRCFLFVTARENDNEEAYNGLIAPICLTAIFLLSERVVGETIAFDYEDKTTETKVPFAWCIYKCCYGGPVRKTL